MEFQRYFNVSGPRVHSCNWPYRISPIGPFLQPLVPAQRLYCPSAPITGNYDRVWPRHDPFRPFHDWTRLPENDVQGSCYWPEAFTRRGYIVSISTRTYQCPAWGCQAHDKHIAHITGHYIQGGLTDDIQTGWEVELSSENYHDVGWWTLKLLAKTSTCVWPCINRHWNRLVHSGNSASILNINSTICRNNEPKTIIHSCAHIPMSTNV